MAIAFRSQASLTNGSRTTTTVNMPAGVQAGDVVLVFCSTGNSAAVAITPPASLSANPVVNLSYSDTNPPWTVSMRVWRYTVVGSGDPASFSFTHASASSEAVAMAFSGVDTATPLDATPATNAATGTTATMTGLTTVTAAAMLVGYRGSWDGSAITPPAGWTERLDQPVTWVGTQTWATPSATGNFSIPAGNGGGYPYGTMLVALRPASDGPAPISGALAASLPALTAGVPSSAISGTVTVPTYAGTPAASTPVITAGPPTAAVTGATAVPTYSGTPTASTPELEVGPTTAAIEGTFVPPVGDGGLAADLPKVTVGPLAATASGTITAPVYAGDLAASAPEVITGPPTMAATGTSTPPTYSGTLAASTPALIVETTSEIAGTVHTLGDNDLITALPGLIVGPTTSSITGAVAAPVYAGAIAASTATVSIGPTALAAAGTVQAPAVAGTIAASLPAVVVGPLTSQITDTSIPPLPIDGVTITIAADTRGLTLTGEARSMEVST
jgi:hypothetical protein